MARRNSSTSASTCRAASPTRAWSGKDHAQTIGPSAPRAPDIRRRCLVEERSDRFRGRQHLLAIAAEPAHRDRMRLGFLLADGKDRRDLSQRVFADLVVDLLVAEINLD